MLTRIDGKTFLVPLPVPPPRVFIMIALVCRLSSHKAWSRSLWKIFSTSEINYTSWPGSPGASCIASQEGRAKHQLIVALCLQKVESRRQYLTRCCTTVLIQENLKLAGCIFMSRQNP